MKLKIFLPLLMYWLGGCAIVYEGRYDYDQGWREAIVRSLGLDTTALAVSLDCRGPATPARIAYVQYHSGMRQRYAVITVPEGTQLHPHQRIYVNIRDCKQGIVSLAIR